MYNPIYNHITFYDKYRYNISNNQLYGLRTIQDAFKDTPISSLVDLQKENSQSYNKYTDYIQNLEKSMKELNTVSRDLNNVASKLTSTYVNPFDERKATSSDPKVIVKALNGAAPGIFDVSVTKLATESMQTTDFYNPNQNFKNTTGLDPKGSFSLMYNNDNTKRIDIDLTALGINDSTNVRTGLNAIANEINAKSRAGNLKFEASVLEDPSGQVQLQIKSTKSGAEGNFSFIDTAQTYNWDRYHDVETTEYFEGGWSSEGGSEWMISGYSNYTFDSTTGIYSPVGSSSNHFTMWGSPATVYQISGDGKSIQKFESNGTNQDIIISTQGTTSTTTHSQGAYANRISGYFDEYNNGVLYEDEGYWYERGGLTATQDVPTFFKTANYISGEDGKYSINGEEFTNEKNTIVFDGGYASFTVEELISDVRIVIENDTREVEQNIYDFVRNYNEMTSFLKENTDYVRSDLKPFFNSLSQHKRADLAQIGITVNKDHSLSINSTQLNNALNNDLGSVRNVFINTYHALASESKLRTDSIVNSSLGSFAREDITRQMPKNKLQFSYEMFVKNYTNQLIFQNGAFLKENY